MSSCVHVHVVLSLDTVLTSGSLGVDWRYYVRIGLLIGVWVCWFQYTRILIECTKQQTCIIPVSLWCASLMTMQEVTITSCSCLLCMIILEEAMRCRSVRAWYAQLQQRLKCSVIVLAQHHNNERPVEWSSMWVHSWVHCFMMYVTYVCDLCGYSWHVCDLCGYS